MRKNSDLAQVPKLVLHLAFLFSGMATVMIGQVLPILARSFSLNDLELGYFFPAQFAGSVTGTVVSSLFSKRGRYAIATAVGCGLMSIGIYLIGGGSFSTCLCGFLINGLGIGMTLPSINLLVLEFSPTRSAAALSILNFCWGVGAIFCKPFVDLASGGTQILPVSATLAGTMLLFGIAVLFLVPRTAVEKSAGDEPAAGGDVRIWTRPIAWTIAIFNFIHVGFESGIGGWLATYTDRLANRQVLDVVSPTFLYFTFFVAGRGIAPLFFRYLKENGMLLASLLVLLVGTLITVAANDLLALSIGASVAGFGTSAIFPTNVSRFANTFGPAANRRATPLFLCGTAGAAVVTWLIGLFSNRAGDLRSGMLILVISVLALVAMQIVLSIKARKSGMA